MKRFQLPEKTTVSPSERKLELLAPARDIAIGRQAILHGADAVYVGAESFGARAAACNPVDDLAKLVEFAHSYNTRIYVTLNTLIYDDELLAAEKLIRRLYDIGIDALIVQDLSVLRMDIPPIALHASTQCDTRTPEKARFLQDCGFSQIVLARELSLEEIRAVVSAVTVPVEVFVHGALCVSYSGDCQASLFATGRSANRGECAQMCRLPYSLTDADGRKLAPDAHYLSLRDMNRLERIGDLADAGVSSFKIEGRLKDSDYVRNAVAAYSQAIDRVIAASDGRYSRSSSGNVEYAFEPDVSRSFNRRFTSYFLDGRPSQSERLASLESPKWIGVPVGTVISVRGRSLKVDSREPLNNGDGLGYFDRDGRYCGFRVNKVDRGVVYAASDIRIEAGTKLYRNRDKVRDDIMSGETARRSVGLKAVLRRVDSDRISLSFTDECGVMAEQTAVCCEQPARSPQLQSRQGVIAKLGGTVYRLAAVDDRIPDDSFVAASVLADLRRRTVALLDNTRKTVYRYDYRRGELAEIKSYSDRPLDRHDNVANRLARKFYADHGIAVREGAAEVDMPDRQSDRRVMTTRYCLRRELGACLRTAAGSRLPSPLFLRAAGVEYRLDFDCAGCRMMVMLPASAR